MSQEPMEGLYCMQCRALIPARTNPCPHCGQDPLRQRTPEEARALRELDGLPEAPRSKICPDCKKPSAIDAQFCARCGHAFRTRFAPEDPTRVAPMPPPQGYHPQQRQLPPAQYPQRPAQTVIYRPGQSPTGAILLGFFLTGGGQMLNGQVVKGVVILFTALFSGIITLGLSSLVIWILAFIDAILVAQRLQRGEAVTEWQCF